MPKTIICRDWDEEKHEVSVDRVSFRISVYGVLIQDNQILLCPQRNGHDFPGGGMEIYETVEQCLVREFREETGLSVSMQKLVHCENEFYYALNREKAYNNLLLYYTCSYVDGEISTDGFDEHEKEYAREAEWVPLSKIEKIKFHNPVDSVAVIRKALNIMSITS